MAVDKKITELTDYAGASVVPADDVLAIVDVANDETKKIDVDALAAALSVPLATPGIDFSAFTKGVFKGLSATLWRMTTTEAVGTQDPLGAADGDWELADDTDPGTTGTPMEFYLGSATAVTDGNPGSSGIFSFGSTGYWLVLFQGQTVNASAADVITGTLKGTNDNSTYADLGAAQTNHYAANKAGNMFLPVLLKIIDISNDKIKIRQTTVNGNGRFVGDTTNNVTSLLFIKLADL